MSNVNVNRAIAMALAGNYKIGGDGEMMVEEIIANKIPVTKGSLISINLTKKISSFDMIAFTISLSSYSYSGVISVNNVRNASTSNWIMYDIGYDTKIPFGFYALQNSLDSTTIQVQTWNYDVTLTMTGIKFTGTKSIDYSTEEQVIGKWIDGKPLYQKTFNYTNNLTANTTIRLAYLGGTLKNIVNINGYFNCIYNNETWRVLLGSGTNGNCPVTLQAWNYYDGLYVLCNRSVSNVNLTITIQYTKTTD